MLARSLRASVLVAALLASGLPSAQAGEPYRPDPALVDAAPRKALSAPKDKKDRPKTGAVPSVPRRKDE